MGGKVISMPLPSEGNTEKTDNHPYRNCHSLSSFDANDVFAYSVDVVRDIIISDALYGHQFHHTELSRQYLYIHL
jgi:hypothetical protein